MKKEKEHDFVLDKALRHLYSSLRNTWCFVMAIEITDHDGRKWRVDTVDEAMAFRERLKQADRMAPRWRQAPKRNLTADTVVEMLEQIGPLQAQFLGVLARSSDPVASEEIVKALKLDSEIAFAGVLSGLSKQLKKLSLNPYEVYLVRVAWTGKEKMRLFNLTEDFKLTADELGWPDVWKDNVKGKENNAPATNDKRK
ncbi:MAG TPA: hypothetical protein VJX30_16745 [Terriglobales bacterium]|jgi:hypothetical protein|nr:hypothetical protein [Terriglobales bacterium]